MNYKSMLLGLMATVAVFQSQPAQACTGITLTAKDSTRILARTIEWGGSDLNSCYVVVPRGYTVQSYVPGGQDGMKFTPCGRTKGVCGRRFERGRSLCRSVLFPELRTV